MPTPKRLAVRAEHVGEFVYGTTTVLIALAGLEIVGGVPPASVGAIVLTGSVAIWLAHSYASYLGAHASRGLQAHDEPAQAEIGHALRTSAPIVLAAIPATLLLGGATLGWWGVSDAIRAANLAAILVLGAAGWIGARATGSSTSSALIWAVGTASIGIGIVGIELLLH
jgi:hypothetical protein